VTLRGKKYAVEEATTVEELQSQIQKLAGKDEKSDVLFSGKRLDPFDILSDVGVSDGASLNMVPSLGKKATSSSSSSSSSQLSSPAAAASSSSSSTTEAAANPMQDYLKQAGVDTDKLEEFMKGMGGGAGGAGGGGADGEKMPSMQESMEMMSGMINSPLFQDYMKDPERLEQSRQMILNNPMMKSMMGSMPGMEELLNDKDAWRESMQAAAEMYQNMDTNQLMQAMMGGGGAGGPGGPAGMGGLFDGTLDKSAASAALDELSEEED